MIKKAKAYAKINLYLEIKNKKKNGYHKLEMIMAKIDLYDEITFKDCSEIKVTMDKNICSMEENLCYKIAAYLKEKKHIAKGIDIDIKKNIPDKAGLGGGSSDAAVVLEFLNDYWGIGFSKRKLKKIASKFGCDIPFFLGGDISYAYNYGEKIKPYLREVEHRDIILIIPKEKLETRKVFEQYNFTGKNRIKKKKKKLLIYNELEKISNKLLKGALCDIKEKVKKIGIETCVMTGSGSTMVCYLNGKYIVDELVGKIKEEIKGVDVMSAKLKMYTS